MKKFQDKVVFITGGSSGIGKASAIAVAKEGAKVAIADLAQSDYKSVISEIEKGGGQAIFVPCDVTSDNDVKMAIDAVVAKWGRLDVAFNNAGIGGKSAPIAEMDSKNFELVIRINLIGVFYCMKHELAVMQKQKSGSIVNMSSILGQVGFANSSAYSAAKHGIIGLTQTAALEYASQNIRINALGPGFIDTPLLSYADKETKDLLVSKHPIGRLGRADEIAKAFLWLASDDASFNNGSYIPVDGGYLAP